MGWRIYIIGKRLQHLGTASGPQRREGCRERDKFAVRPALQSKITVSKIADGHICASHCAI